MINKCVRVLSLISVLSLVACGQPSPSSMPKETRETTNQSSLSQKEEALSPDEIAAKEGDHTEQVVVQVTDEGYVMSHGDHYHFYNGKVGFDALISRDMVMADSHYVLDSRHIVSDVADGHIIKVGETYYLYVTVEHPQQLR